MLKLLTGPQKSVKVGQQETCRAVSFHLRVEQINESVGFALIRAFRLRMAEIIFTADPDPRVDDGQCQRPSYCGP